MKLVSVVTSSPNRLFSFSKSIRLQYHFAEHPTMANNTHSGFKRLCSLIMALIQASEKLFDES